jgi:hypothetical protein
MARKKNGGMTKQEAVRQALSELGNDAKPTQIKGFVKERFGIEMTTDHISTAKGDILRKAGGKGKSVAKKPAQVQSAATANSSGSKTGIPLEDILSVKDLVGRLGAEPLRTLIDAFAK